MTELNQKNREIYLSLCREIWDFDENSMKYIEHRTSDEWEPVPELKALIENSKDAVYEDQRLRFEMDMSNPTIQSFFEEDDKAYRIFKDTFRRAIAYANDKYNTKIAYKEFIENKVVFKKNITKIKKVFELLYAENTNLFEMDSDRSYSKETCERWIVSKFETIGSYKKSAKKLQFVISFNPIDWLLASTAENFSSCFNLDNPSGGFSYCLGIPFLCGDKNRTMLYITNGAKKEFMGLKVDSVQTRTWCILDTSDTMNIVKWYPNDTVGTSPVVAITGNSRFKNREYFHKGKYDLDVLATKKGAVISVYNDMGKWTEIAGKLVHVGNDKTGQQVFSKNLINCSQKKSSFQFNTINTGNLFNSHNFAYKIPEWKKYGVHLDMMFPTLRCTCCKESDKGGFLTNNNNFLCYDCYKDKTFTCDCCGRTFYKTEGTSHEVETIERTKITICNSCYDNKLKYVCDCCGKWDKRETVFTKEREHICHNCVESDKYGKCEGCGILTKNVTINYNTFTKIITKNCNDCNHSESTAPIATFGRYYRVLSGRPNAGSFRTE